MMLVIVTAVLTGVPARGELPPRSPPDSIRRLIDLVQLAWLEPDVTCAQFASTDPSGRGDDHGHFRKLSGRQAVLAEMTGPGVIVRIWSANPQGRLRLFLDGEAAPRLDAPFADVLAGSTPPFVAPLAAHQGGGWVSYLPIPYARSCRVEVGDLEHPGELYYHIQYLSYPAGTPMRSFTTAASSADARDRDEVLARWQNPAESPIARAAGDRDETRDAMLAPGASLALAEAEGKGAVLGCRIAPGSTEPDVLRGLVLRASFDAQPEPTVLAPIGDFFGVGFGVTPYRSLALGWSETGGYTFLPMPFYERARLSLENHSARPVRVHTSVWLRPLAELPPGFGTFHAEFRAVDRVGPELYQFASMSGPGKYVGATFTLQGVGDLWYLEGNEQLVRDGESRPAIVGTGTEDFFNGGWYWDSGPFAAPLWGLGRKEEWTTNRTTPWRIQIPDAVPYRTSLVAQIEHGSANAVRDAAYASVAFWYGAPQPVRALEPQALALPRLWVKRRKDALAAASLPWTPPLAPAALCRFEDLAPDLRASEWPLHQAFPVSYLDTAGARLEPRLLKLVDRSTARFHIDEADRYAVRCVFVGRPDGPDADVLIDGELVGHVATRAASVAPLPPPDLGTIGLTRGEHALELRVAARAWLGFDSIAFDSAAPFVRAWWIAPPVPASAQGSVEEAPPGEALWLAPTFDPGAAGWRELPETDEHLDLNRLVSASAPVLGYLMTFVHAAEAATVRARLGSDDGARVWVNGQLVWSHALHRPFTADEDRFDVPLAAGWNRVLVKVRNDDGGYAMSLRLADPSGRLHAATRAQ